jgi:Fe2+ transport system protein FeoA
MTLTLARVQQRYRIVDIRTDEESALAARLRQLGFIPGVELTCEALAPLLKHPVLVRIRGVQVALSLSEARLVGVEEA